jgi:molybdopterin-guanine dinucleotide biosynthesis protein A
VGSQVDRAVSESAAVGAVLAGGLGTRIGGGKPGLHLAGRPLISFPLAAIEEAGLRPLVIAKRDSPLPPLEVDVVLEPDQPRHPLCGIVAALREAAGRPVVAVACDMPFASPALLAWLASAQEPLVVTAPDGAAQPLLARYDSSLLPALEDALERGQPLRETVGALRPHLLGTGELARFGDPRRLCFNVNTPADLATAERMLQPAGG